MNLKARVDVNPDAMETNDGHEDERTDRKFASYMSHVTRKPVFGVSNQVGSNQPAQLMRLARVLKFRLKQEDVLYYPGSE